MYATERARAAAAPPSEDGNPAALRAYLEGLELKIGVERLCPEGIARASQLTQKTNQFNLTTIRRSESEVTALLADPTWHLYSLEASDRFGDYGTVGLLFAQRTSDAPDTFVLETMLLSCRVLGRGIETAFLASAAEDLWREGARHLVGRFEPTSKNGPAAEFLSMHRFRKVGDGHLPILDLNEARFEVPYIAVVSRPDFDKRPAGAAL
jgi:FkbH-like protein